MRRYSWVLLLVASVILGAGLGALQGPGSSRASAVVVGCFGDGLAEPVKAVVQAAADRAAVAVASEPCAAGESVVTRKGFDPYRPELVLLASERSDRPGAPTLPRVVVRALPLGEGAAQRAAVTDYIVASRYRCERTTCYPTTYEVYVASGDPVQDVERRLRSAAGLAARP